MVGTRSSTKAPSARFSSTLDIGYVLNARRALMRKDANWRPSTRRPITLFMASRVAEVR